MTPSSPHPNANDSRRAPVTIDDDLGPQPAPIVVSVPELLEQAVGPLHDLTVTMTDAETCAWAGIDEGGRPVSGKVHLVFEVGGDGKSFVLNSTVVIDSEGA